MRRRGIREERKYNFKGDELEATGVLWLMKGVRLAGTVYIYTYSFYETSKCKQQIGIQTSVQKELKRQGTEN